MLHSLQSFIRARLAALCVIAVIAGGIALAIHHSATVKQATTAALSSTDPSVRNREVLDLAKRGTLVDALVDTEDPNTDATSPQNKRSIAIRQNAADSVNSLVASGQLPDQQGLDTLFPLYKDADAGVKGKATDGIAAIGKKSHTLTRTVADRLKDGDPDIRAAAVEALGKIGGDDAARTVEAMIGDPTTRDSVEAALVKIGKAAVPYIAKHADESDLLYREKIIGMLGDVAAATGAPTVIKATDPAVPDLRRVALIALCKIVQAAHDAAQADTTAAATAAKAGKPAPAATGPAAAEMAEVDKGVPVLIAALKNAQDDGDARAQAAVTLGRVAAVQASSSLVQSLQDFDARIRQAALTGVESAGQTAVPMLAALVQNPGTTETTRQLGAEALGAIGTPSAISAVSTILGSRSDSAGVRQQAVIGLGRGASPSAVPVLVRALSDPDGTVASSAADALLNPSLSQAAIAPLISTFGSSGNGAFYASSALSRMGDLAVHALTQDLASARGPRQVWDAVTLGQTDSKRPEILPALKPLVSSADTQVSSAAQAAIDRLSSS